MYQFMVSSFQCLVGTLCILAIAFLVFLFAWMLKAVGQEMRNKYDKR